jgi:hypothetical protein
MHLPSDGAFFASRRGGPEFRGWDTDRYALVALVNAARVGNYIQTMVHRDPKRAKPAAPPPFPTPDGEDHRPKPGSFAAIAASMFAAQRHKEEMINGR